MIDLDALTEITDTKNAGDDKGVESSTLKQSTPLRKIAFNPVKFGLGDFLFAKDPRPFTGAGHF